jgi:glycosyltransferase involved in cell wall biosynthesis
MNQKTILYIVHNHPSVRPGGAEGYALELYEGMRATNEFHPVLLAKTGPPVSNTSQIHGGVPFGHVNGDPNQYFLYTNNGFDWFYGVLKNKEIITFHFRQFLEAIRPDVVHFQHTLFFGYDMVREVRNVLPSCAIVYTLQEFLPICHRDGQMLRNADNTPCLDSSPLRCHECFPQYSPQDFFMRRKFIQSQLSLVDRFIAPSRFLLERYVDWGIPRDKILFEEYGRHPMVSAKPQQQERVHNRLAFFGQISPYKGVDVLLEAMRLLDDSGERAGDLEIAAERNIPKESRPHLHLYGANLDVQEPAFQTRVRTLLEQTRRNVTFAGRYKLSQQAALMSDADWVIVPSIWWENSPLVIQEAFGHQRPVICSDIGGMAEKVTDGVNGLHFRAGDSRSLAQTIQRAVTTPGLWESLQKGIPQVHSMEQHLEIIKSIYNSILEPQKTTTLCY